MISTMDTKLNQKLCRHWLDSKGKECIACLLPANKIKTYSGTNQKEVTMSNAKDPLAPKPGTYIDATAKPTTVKSTAPKAGKMKKAEVKRLKVIGKKGGKTAKPSTRVSKSGKFKSIRHSATLKERLNFIEVIRPLISPKHRQRMS